MPYSTDLWCMKKHPDKVVLSHAEYELLRQRAAEHESMADALRTAQQAREQAEEKAHKLTQEVSLLHQTLAEEKARFVKVVRAVLFRKSERYKPVPVEKKKEEEVATALIEAPQTPPEETPCEDTASKAEKQARPAKKRRSHPGRRPIPDHLPRVDVVLEPEEDVSGCIKMGEEITEELDYMPGYFFVRRFIRPKYARPNNEGVAIASAPVRVIEKGIPGPNLIAFILISKYVDHLPLYRQLAIFRRCGIHINEVTFNGWVRQAGVQLNALYARIRSNLLQADYLMADETTIKVLDSQKKGTTHQGYYWVYMDPLRRNVVFVYEKGRSGDYVKQHLQGFKGRLQSDAYRAYTSFKKDNPDIQLLGCWAHARRKFIEALAVEKVYADSFLKKIQHLYAIERFARCMQLDHDERLLVRGHATLILEEIKTDMEKVVEELTPKNLLAVAINYALNQWDELLVYTTDGKLEIDNNWVENSIRPVAVGRKNYLFAGDHEAAQRAAVIYSVVASCKALDINPMEYLADIMDRLVIRKLTDIDDLLPWNWKPLSSP
jgi:transposase